MSDAAIDTFFETTHYGVRARRSQHQVTYDLPPRPFITLLGVFMVLIFANAALTESGFLSVLCGVAAVLYLLAELEAHIRKTRIVLTSERLSLEFRTFWRSKPWSYEWEIAEIRSISWLRSPFNGLLLRTRGGAMKLLYLQQRGRAARYLYHEVAAWYRANAQHGDGDRRRIVDGASSVHALDPPRALQHSVQ